MQRILLISLVVLVVAAMLLVKPTSAIQTEDLSEVFVAPGASYQLVYSGKMDDGGVILQYKVEGSSVDALYSWYKETLPQKGFPLIFVPPAEIETPYSESFGLVFCSSQEVPCPTVAQLNITVATGPSGGPLAGGVLVSFVGLPSVLMQNQDDKLNNL